MLDQLPRGRRRQRRSTSPSSTATPTTRELVGGDPDTDVAVLKIDAPPEKLFPVAFGSSSNLLVGQRVFAIGNPFGFERTLSTGIISSLDRSLPSRRGPRLIKSIIQIDAAINPGNSGGPLLDSHARMIGMNTAIANTSKSEQNAGVGFAIPDQHDRPRRAATDPERPRATSRRGHRQGLPNRSRAADRLDGARRPPSVPDCKARGSKKRSSVRARSSPSTETSIGPPPT